MRLTLNTALLCLLALFSQPALAQQSVPLPYFVEEFAGTYRSLYQEEPSEETVTKLEAITRHFRHFRRVCSLRNDYLDKSWWGRIRADNSYEDEYEDARDCLIEETMPPLVANLSPRDIVTFETIIQRPRCFAERGDGVSTSIARRAFEEAIHGRFLQLSNPEGDAEVSALIERIGVRLINLSELPDIIAKTATEAIELSNYTQARDPIAQQDLDYLRAAFNNELVHIKVELGLVEDLIESRNPVLLEEEEEVLGYARVVIEDVDKIDRILLPDPFNDRLEAVVVTGLYFTPAMPAAAVYSGGKALSRGDMTGCIDLIPVGGHAFRMVRESRRALAATSAVTRSERLAAIGRGLLTEVRLPSTMTATSNPNRFATRLDRFVDTTDFAFKYERAYQAGLVETGLMEEAWNPIDRQLEGLGFNPEQRGVAQFVFATGPQSIIAYRTLGRVALQRGFSPLSTNLLRTGGALIPPATMAAIGQISLHGETQYGGVPIDAGYFEHTGNLAWQSAPYSGGLWYLGRFQWGARLALTTEGIGFSREQGGVYDAWADGNTMLALSREAAAGLDFFDPAGPLLMAGVQAVNANPQNIIQMPPRPMPPSQQVIPLQATGTDGVMGPTSYQLEGNDTREEISQLSPPPLEVNNARRGSRRDRGRSDVEGELRQPETLREFFGRKLRTVRSALAALQFQSGLSEAELIEASTWEDAYVNAFIRERIGIDFESSTYPIAHGKAKELFLAEITRAITNYFIRENARLVLLDTLVTHYLNDARIVATVNAIAIDLKENGALSRYANSAFDLTDGPVMGKIADTLVENLRRRQAHLKLLLDRNGINHQGLVSESRAIAEEGDTVVNDIYRRLGQPQANQPTSTVAVPSSSGSRPVSSTQSDSETHEPTPRIDPAERGAVMGGAIRSLPELYTWDRALRRVRRNTEGGDIDTTDILIALDGTVNVDHMKAFGISNIRTHLLIQIREIEAAVRRIAPQDGNKILRSLRHTEVDLHFDFEAHGYVLDPVEEIVEDADDGSGSTESNGNGLTQSLSEQAEFLTLETMPDCFAITPHFARQYGNIQSGEIRRVNLGLLKLAAWFGSSGEHYANALNINAQQFRSNLYKARLQMGQHGWRVLFSYTGENGSRRIVLEEVGRHGDVSGGD